MSTSAERSPRLPSPGPPGAAPLLLRRALVVHRDAQQRRAIGADLRARGVDVVLEAGTADEALAAALTPGPRDLAIVALDEHPAAWSLVADLQRRHWSSVVVTTARPRVELVQLALSSGVAAVLLPGPEADGAADAAAPEAPGDGSALVPDVHGVPRRVSERELEVLQCAADGLPTREIARRLDISPLTAKSHFHRIARRLGTGDRGRLVLLALRAGAIR